jgi:hypothetical protein
MKMNRGGFLATMILLTAGCTREPSGTEGRLALPPANQVRIVGAEVGRTPEKLHWQWNIIGERNWTKAAANGQELSLEQTSKLNDVNKKSGTNIWKVDILVEKKASDSGKVTWKTVLHGIEGTTVEETGEAAGGIDSVRIALTQDTVPSLPAEVVLARLGESVFRLKIAK